MLAWDAVLGSLLSGVAAVAAAATISTVVEDFAVEIPGGGTLTIRRIEIAGKGSSGADLVALFDSASPRPLADRLRGFDAPSIGMPEVVAEYPLGDVKVRQVYRDVRLIEVAHGRIGAASVGRIDITLSGPRLPSVHGSIGGTIARNVDLVLLARLFTTPRSAVGEALAPLVDYVSLKDIEIDAPGTLNVAVERISAGRLRVSALNVPLADLPARLQAVDRASQLAAEREKVLLIGQDLLESFSLGSFELRGVQVALKRDALLYRIDRIAVGDVAQPRISTIAVEGLAFSGADANTRVGMIEVRGLDFRQMLESVVALVRRPGPDRRGMDGRSLVVGFDRILIAGAAVTPRPRGGSERSAAPDSLFRMERLEVAAANPTNSIPDSLYGRADGVALSTRLSSPDTPFGGLAKMGYEAFVLSSAHFDLAWNQATGEIVLDKLSAEMPDIGAVEIAATLTGANADLFSPAPAVVQAAVLGLRFKQVDAVARNAGIVERLIQLAAKRDATSVEAVREKLLRDVTVDLPDRLGGTRAARSLGDALGRFIAQPRSLHVSVSAAGGVGFAELPLLRSPVDLLDRLQVSATVNQ